MNNFREAQPRHSNRTDINPDLIDTEGALRHVDIDAITGIELDLMASMINVVRTTGELDENLRARIRRFFDIHPELENIQNQVRELGIDHDSTLDTILSSDNMVRVEEIKIEEPARTSKMKFITK